MGWGDFEGDVGWGDFEGDVAWVDDNLIVMVEVLCRPVVLVFLIFLSAYFNAFSFNACLFSS